MPNRPFTLLHNRDFRSYTLAVTLSQFGDRLTHMLIPAVIGERSPGSFFAYSQGALVFVLPTLLLTPFAGIIADRCRRTSILIRVHQLQFTVLILGGLGVSLTCTFIPFWTALFTFFGLDLLNNVAAPALLPSLVAKEDLLSANSVNLTLARIATILGMVIGGFLIQWTSWRYALMLDACCHLSAGLIAMQIATDIDSRILHYRRQVAQPLGSLLNQTARRFLRELTEVARLALNDRTVATVLASIAVTAFVSAGAYTILLRIIQQKLGLGTAGIGIFTGILAVGMVTGAALMGYMPPRFSRLRLILAIIIIYGILFLVGARYLNLWLMGVVAVVAGIAFSCLGVAQITTLQERVDNYARGRIFSVREFISNAVFLITALLTGALADTLSLTQILVGIGGTLVTVGAAGFVWIGSLNPQSCIVDKPSATEKNRDRNKHLS